jgi:phosphoribosylaminoimidazolecarboxamide formyltransferase/IMP cyclohydrolase
MFKNILVSVSDKSGLIEFLRPFVATGARVVSTGGTLRFLRENDIQAIEVSEQTGFPEVMDGRVKTLHPRIHISLLARLNNVSDDQLLVSEGLEPFDLVVVNLYPFEAARDRGCSGDELIEFIDIGGPSLLRAAAKNHERVSVVCEPADYEWITRKVEGKSWTLGDRRSLAARVYAHTSRYDDMISKTLFAESETQSESESQVQSPKTLVGHLVNELRYGENPQQKGWWFRDPMSQSGLHLAETLHGKALSFNNILDLDAACAAVAMLSSPAAVAVKHNNPCGVGTAQAISDAVRLAIQADPVSVFGGIIALNRSVDLPAAELMSKLFLECVIAPAFEPDALACLKRKKDLRLLMWPSLGAALPVSREFRTVCGGFLVQTPDQVEEWSLDWKIFGAEPSEGLKRDLMLAWRVCARLKSNAIAIVSHGQTVGLGMGQVNRVDSVEQAITRMKHHHPEAQDPVLASDAFFPFADSIERIAEAGIRWIIQPGGSIRDEEVLRRASELGVSVVLTGVRHFRH